MHSFPRPVLPLLHIQPGIIKVPLILSLQLTVADRYPNPVQKIHIQEHCICKIPMLDFFGQHLNYCSVSVAVLGINGPNWETHVRYCQNAQRINHLSGNKRSEFSLLNLCPKQANRITAKMWMHAFLHNVGAEDWRFNQAYGRS